MQKRMLAVLLASWLVLARSVAVGPTDEDAEQPPPPPSEDMMQVEINPFDQRPVLGVFQQEEISPEYQQELPGLPILIHGEPQPGFGGLTPRSGGRQPHPGNLAEFPPGRPSASNIDSICAEGRQRAAYGPWNLPQTGFSHLMRQGNALNDLEVLLGRCCKQKEDDKLPCAQEAWTDALEMFCGEEFAVKTKHYHCCRLTGPRRDRCFAKAAPFPNYDFAGPEATRGETPSACDHGDPSRCKPKVLANLPIISFPPGRPTEANIKNICKLRKFRPVYPKSALPKSDSAWFVRQALAINRLENKFKKCCQKQDVSCAHDGWEATLTQYCKQEFSVKTRPHFCCKEKAGEERSACFANQAPFPAYDKEVRVVSLAEVTPSLLDLLCGQATLLSKKRHVPALIQNITEPCCDLQGEERTQCAQQEKSVFIATLCDTPQTLWRDPKRCCSQGQDATRLSCFDSSYLGNITLASAEQALQPTDLSDPSP